MTLNHLVEVITAAAMLATPLAGFTVSEATESPVIGGVAVLVATILLVPVVRWMMQRQDTMQKESSDAAVRREQREEKRSEAFQQQVAALGAILTELRLLNENHKEFDQNRAIAVKEILERIDEIPEKVATFRPRPRER